MAKKHDLTPREQAAVKLFLHEGETLSPVAVMRLAYPGSLEDFDRLNDVAASASRWIRTQKVKAYMDEQRAILNDRKAKERMKIEAEIVARFQTSADTGGHKIDGFVDYSQPSAQLAKLNELINTASDPGEVLDAMKVLLSKQAELAPGRKDSPQARVYLPLACSECRLKAILNEVRLHHPDVQARLRTISDDLKNNP